MITVPSLASIPAMITVPNLANNPAMIPVPSLASNPAVNLIAVASIITVAAAVRSTWSPCGWSMLSTITPLGEKGRGRSYRATAFFFVAGAVIGGAVLGAAMALVAAAAGILKLSTNTSILVTGVCCLLVAVSDSGVFGVSLPIHRRQVNEDWLGLYRSWVYGGGFGFQVGVGFATYLTTGALYLMVVAGTLTGRPLMAGALGVGFGLIRGLAVLAARNLDTPESLRAFHRAFERAGTFSRRCVVAVEVLCGAAALSAFGWETPMAVTVVAAVIAGVQFGRARLRPGPVVSGRALGWPGGRPGELCRPGDGVHAGAVYRGAAHDPQPL